MAENPRNSVGLVRVQTPAQVTQEAAQAAAALAPQPIAPAAIDNLAAHLKTCWEKAQRAKTDVETKMLKMLRQVNGEYEADQLQAIKQIDAPIIFMLLTDAKCRSAEAWIKDVLIQPNEKPWDIEPTPEPELPAEVVQSIRTEFMTQTFSAMALGMAQGGQEIDPIMLASQIRGMIPQFEEEMKKLIQRRAKENAGKMKVKVDDALTEGSWYKALEDALYDIVHLKAGFIKGPIKRKEKKLAITTDPQTGDIKITVVENIIDKYERRSPFDIYPSPNSTGINDGFLIDKISLRPKDLKALVGVDGYNRTEIEAVLKEVQDGGLKEWTRIESERAKVENGDSSQLWEYANIDCLEYWGDVSGALLRKWGMTADHIKDETEQYAVCAWLIGNHVIGAVINQDPLGERPFQKVSYKEKPGVFWGDGLPEILVDLQRCCNACARAIIHNVGVASGPQVEIDKDRLAPGESTKIWPWRVWLTTNETMTNGPAINFYMPPIVVERLIAAFNFFSRLADEYCGVPAYAHGDPQVGGGGNTASGLSMLITQAARGIKSLIKNIDSKLIEPTIRKQYFVSLTTLKNVGIIPDYKIVAKGSSSLLAKEQQAIRRTEFLTQTANPFDIQIMGVDGRKYLLREAAKALDLDTDRIVPEGATAFLSPASMGFNQPGAGATLGPDGNPVVGQDFRMFNAGGTPSAAAK